MIQVLSLLAALTASSGAAVEDETFELRLYVEGMS